MTDNNRLTLSQLKQLLRLYIRRGASANFKVKPSGELEAVPDKDTERRKDAPIPAELLPLLEQLSEDGSIPQEWQNELKRYHEQLQRLEDRLTPEEKAELDQYRQQAESASENQLNKLEQSEEMLPDAVRNTLEQQRRLRQSLAGKVTQAWKKKNMPEEESSDSSDEQSDENGETDPNQKSKDKKNGKPENNDGNDDGDDESQADNTDDGSESDDADADQNGDADDSADGDGSESDSGSDANSPSQNPNGDGQDSQNQNGQPSDSNPQGDGGESDQQPEDTREGLEKYKEELEKKSGDQGKGDEDGDGENDNSDGDGKEGDANGENQEGKDQKGQPQQKEDSSKGLKDYEKELREKQKQEQQKADEQNGEDGDGGQGQQGKPGNKPGQPDKGQEKAESAYNLSNMKANETDVYEAKKALERLLSRGRKNPQQLPRWNKRELTKRLATYRNLNLARKPTLEQKAILMIIDNSPSMAHLEKQSRALAAALSAAGGPNGATVIVCLSSNGDYEYNPHNKQSEDGLWFVNGKCVGRLPEPPQNGGFNTKSNASCWTWFIRKYLPQRRYDVHIIGFYGDYDGAKQWSFISNTCKDVMCTWFNPMLKGQGPVMEIPNMGSHRAPSSPYGSGWGIGGEPGYTPGDKRYETFRGKYFMRVDTIRDIAMALKKAIGL